MELQNELAAFVAETTYRDLPPETIEFTKQLALKTAAGMVAGSGQPTGRKVIPFVQERADTHGNAGVIAGGFKTNMIDAVLINGVTAHASELEDDKITLNQETSWDITTYPLTFPLAQKHRLSGKEFIVASAVGLEALSRLNVIPDREAVPDVGILAASAGAAAAAAKSMRLDEEGIKNALGMAIGGGSMFLPNTGTDAHYMDSSFQCVRGVRAAQLAKEGLTGNPEFETLFESFYGERASDASEALDGLGDTWLFRGIGVKKYPTCFHTHRYIDALRELLDEHDLTYEEIEEVEIETGKFEENLLDRPNPTSGDDAKFSFQQTLGATLRHGDVDYDHVNEEAIHDPQYEKARSKITLDVNPDWQGRSEGYAGVTIAAADGQTFSQQREHLIGSKEDPLSEEQFRDLYRKYTSGILTDEAVKRTADEILSIEESSDLTLLMDRLTFKTV